MATYVRDDLLMCGNCKALISNGDWCKKCQTNDYSKRVDRKEAAKYVVSDSEKLLAKIRKELKAKKGD